MRYNIDTKFDDKSLISRTHFSIIVNVVDEEEAEVFHSEILAALQRVNAIIKYSTLHPIDNDLETGINILEQHKIYLKNATHFVEIKPYYLENPDQDKSMSENLAERHSERKGSLVSEGYAYSYPVRVVYKDTQEPFDDQYFLSLEHLIPINKE
ncbi:hypothetical protein [Amniculibacterium sp. G2-70]|uniref:hypothetical protein n=1 Tax=Amniculibacterium sp. G2-70 TaxID=2767188 RepID=UPI0016542327|nr:hypothetical protein [Amniculibacterium sp. G2-70]